VADAPAGNEPESERRRRWHRQLVDDPELTAGALRFANLILHHDGGDRQIRLSIRTAVAKLNVANSTMQDGRDLLVARKWLIPTAIGSLALGRGP
jgi:hypothetical protein